MVEVNNLTSAVIDEGFLKKVAKIVLKGENKVEFELSIVLVGRERIKELNKKYRKKNKATDVLSFNYGDSGEIVICPGQVKTTLARMLVHGILHILGYSHKQMEKKQNYYLGKI